jgi:NTE family protein
MKSAGWTLPERLARNPGLKVGLALGSGAARGWSHAGVIRALEEAGIRPVFCAGTSMGAIVGAAWASGNLDALVEAGLALDRRKVLSFLDVVLPRSGLIEGARLESLLRRVMPQKDLSEFPVRFATVAADLATGRSVVIADGDPVEAVRASISVPGLFTPVARGGTYLVDGGLVDPVPVVPVRAMGADFVIAVDVCHFLAGEAPYLRHGASRTEPDVADVAPAGDEAELNAAEKEPRASLLDRMLGEVSFPSWFPLRFDDRTIAPNLIEVLLSSVAMAEVSIGDLRLAVDRPELLVRPLVGDVRFLEFHRAAESIDAGYEAMRAMLREPAGADGFGAAQYL